MAQKLQFFYDVSVKRRDKMRNLKFKIGLILAVFLLFPSSLLSRSLYRFVYSPKLDMYFGHISVVDVKKDGLDAVVLRRSGKEQEIAVLNLPVWAGDTIRTTERACEILFDTGTSIRLDSGTELKLETILAHSLSSKDKMTNLILQRGQIYVLYREYDSREVFQVITPQAAVKMKDKTVVLVKAGDDGNTEVRVNSGEARILYGADVKHLENKKIKKMEKSIITNDHKLLLSEERQPDPDLNQWSESAEIYLRPFQKSSAFVPKYLRRYREPVGYFIRRFSEVHGEWMLHTLYGFVWRPAQNDYPGGDWQPYLFGRWREIGGMLFWVPEEEWGWVPHHLGLWMWDAKYGWLWIPGTDFAPAWVAWDNFWGYYAWRPWALWDWTTPYLYYHYYFSYWVLNNPSLGEYVPDLYYGGDKPGQKVRRIIKKDQLKRKEKTQLPLPKEIKGIYKKFVVALNNEDDRVIGSLKRLPEHVILVTRPGLNASRIQEKRINTVQMAKSLESNQNLEKIFLPAFLEGHSQKALWSFRRNREILDTRNLIVSSFAKQQERVFSKKGAEIDPVEMASSQKKIASIKERKAVSVPAVSRSKLRTTMRIRDWNPDLKIARRLGVNITYASSKNEVRCPERGMDSKFVAVSRHRLSSRRLSSSGGGGDSRSSSSSETVSSSSEKSKSVSSGSKSTEKTVESTGKVKK